jgi:protein KRI1
MTGLYGDGDDSDIDQEKPIWDDDIDVDDIIPLSQPAGNSLSSSKKKKKKKKGKHNDEDEGGVDIDAMDADVERTYDDEEEEWDGTEEMRKRKLDEYMDEVYGLEFNDMVGLFLFTLRECH